MIITITVEEAFDKDIWIELCEMLGINEWAAKEGLVDSSDTFNLTEEQAIKLGLIYSKPSSELL